MFYFFAMPFVLADVGINYGTTPDLEFEGMAYSGTKITFNSGVGTSPKDEYYLHYHSKTHKMTWLGYTVTHCTGMYSDKVKWIRYEDWDSHGNVLLPASLTWYDYEGRILKAPKIKVEFNAVKLSKNILPKTFFEKPEEGHYVLPIRK
jgi:hypothetical protein